MIILACMLFILSIIYMNMPKVNSLVFPFLLIFSLSGYAQNRKDIKFKHLTVSDGLSVSNVNCVLQDSRGFMWFGTANGLNKYDGYNFTVYSNDPADPSSISSNNINDIVEDRNGNLWIATFGGLNLFNRKQNTFSNYKNNKAFSNSIGSNVIQCLLMDSKLNLWVGTERGISKFDGKTNAFINYSHIDKNALSLANNDVTAILEDPDGHLWIGTRGGGLDEFDPENKNFIHHLNNSGPNNATGNNTILYLYEDSEHIFWIATEKGLYTFNRLHKTFTRQVIDEKILYNVIVRIAEDGDGDIWIGTENDGMYIYHKHTKTFERLKNNADPASLSNNSIYSIYRDHQKNMWVGTYTGAINIYEADRKEIYHYKNIYQNDNSLSENSVHSFAKDKNGGVWMATDGGGLDYFEQAKNKFTHYRENESDKKNSISGNYISVLLLDKDDNLWAASWGRGINLLLKRSRKFLHYRNIFTDTSSLSSDFCMKIYQDLQGNIWIGTLGAGLNLLNRDRKTFTRYLPKENDTGSISSKYIYTVFEDSYSNLWIGTEDLGLNLLDRKKNTFRHYFNQQDNLKSLSNNTVNVIIQDAQRNLWIGTNGGLNKFNYATGGFEVYLEKDGLPSNAIKSIEMDKHGNLWLGTLKGISKFNPQNKTFKNYTVNDGLQGDEFNKASLQTEGGEFYFGGTNGFNTFFPDSIKENKFNPPIAITEFLIFNKALPIGKEGSPLLNHINETKEITLSYKESVFSIGFAALDFIHAKGVKYAYKLKGFDKSWNYVGSRRNSTYTHMDPGDYEFCVKASNSDGVWGKEIKSLKIKIIPPFWATVWFKSLLLLFIIACIYGFIRVRLYNLKTQKRLLEQKVDEKNISLKKLVGQQKRLLDEKEWLIKEIHHRVKNNLHTISGLLDTQSGYLKTDEAVLAISDSQHRVQAMSLIHQKLFQSEDLSSIEMSGYIHELVDYLKHSFGTGQRILFKLDIDYLVLSLSHSLPIGLILNEAITNAIKYAFPANREGIISVSLKHTAGVQYALIIADNGRGLPPDFDLDNSSSMGMSLMAGLSEDMQGGISINSVNGTEINILFSYDPSGADDIVIKEDNRSKEII